MLNIEMGRRGASPVLVGRATEMATLESALEAVRQGDPAALLADQSRLAHPGLAADEQGWERRD
jgi:hypothetical protein